MNAISNNKILNTIQETIQDVRYMVEPVASDPTKSIPFSSIYNFLDLSNPSLVQFYHRNLAYIILIYYIFIGLKYLNSKKEKIINKYIIVFLVLLAQVALGIFTLISGLSLYVALLHQITSILLILTLLNLNYYSSN